MTSVFLQNCIQRDEDLVKEDKVYDEIKTSMMKRDSAKSAEEIKDPDPPVRDGDNWRIQPSN